MFHGYVMISLLLNGCVSGSLATHTDPSTATETTDMSQTSEDSMTTSSPMVYSSKAGDNVTMSCVGIFPGMSSYRILTSNDILASGTSIYWTKSTSETVDLSQTTKYYGGLDANPSLTVIDINCSDAGVYICTSVDNTFVGQNIQLFTIDCSQDANDTFDTWKILTITGTLFGIFVGFVSLCLGCYNIRKRRNVTHIPQSLWWCCCYCPNTCISITKMNDDEKNKNNYYCSVFKITCNCIPVVIIEEELYKVPLDETVTLQAVVNGRCQSNISWKKYKDEKFTEFPSNKAKDVKLEKCNIETEAEYHCKTTNMIGIGTKSKTKLFVRNY